MATSVVDNRGMDANCVTRDVSFAVVICAYALDRWGDLVAAVESVRRQTLPARQIIVVVDHNPELLERARTAFPDVVTLGNREDRGLSGARNTGIAAARASVVAFLDDDATAAPTWLERLAGGYRDRHVMGVGGRIIPVWSVDRPPWFPDEFTWVVGCTYRGMPTADAPVRNLIGANMSICRDVFEAVGGFRREIGRVGTLPTGCEETELCIRGLQARPGDMWLYHPSATVEHRVTPARARWSYFLSRCFAEGQSKAVVSALVGSTHGLASERSYMIRILPLGVGRGLIDAVVHHDGWGLARAAAIVVGLGITTTGYLTKRVSLRRVTLPAPCRDGDGSSSPGPIPEGHEQ